VARQVGLHVTTVRLPVQAGFDATAWLFGLVLAQYLRFDFSLSGTAAFPFRNVLWVAVPAAGLQVVAGMAAGLYRNRWRYGTFDELGRVALSVGAVTLVLVVANSLFLWQVVPASIPFIGAAAALALMVGGRACWRVVVEHALRPTPEGAEPVVVVGAGESGEQLITAMTRNPRSPMLPVALVDDDPGKARLSLKGVRVTGTVQDLADIAVARGVRHVVVAVPSATPELLRRVSDEAVKANLAVQMLPTLDEMLTSEIDPATVRPLTEADLLGRHQVDTDVAGIADYLTGRRVLVTGAGGSIGSELCRQIHRFAPSELVMLDRDESALHAVQLSIEGRGLLDNDGLVVADIRDRECLLELFARRRPEVVFHAAALKHLSLLETHPSEALKTNVIGTQNVLDAAVAAGVDRFVNVSTDKAADPTSILGYSKRIAERLTADTASSTPGTYLSVRFGNVLGSRGSVLTAFRAQIEAGGPVTVTDPEVTRYFMTVEESVELLIQAGAVGQDGEALVLDMGEPVRINDVATRLIAEATANRSDDRRIEIVYTGLRQGEKLHEVLLGADETASNSAHPLISHVVVPPLGFELVAEAALGASPGELRQALSTLSAGDAVSLGRFADDGA
jgi:FlaA1/EpsC-like NDP-sugar epimerase